MNQRILLLMFLLAPLLIKGQVLSNKGRFSVEFDQGCNPMTVNITELDSFGDITRQYFYEENSNITNSKTHTYTSADLYNIIQVIGVDNQGSKYDTLQIQVYDSFEPKVNIEKCSGNEISVTSEENIYDFIRVYFNGSDSVQLINGQSTTFSYATSSIQSVGLKGFFNNSNKNCTDFSKQIVPIPSLPTPSITSVGIKESCKDSFTLYLELASFDSLITYQIELSQNSTNVLYEGKLTDNQLILSDIPFSSTVASYCIRVNSLDPCNMSKVEGTEICKESSSLSLSPFETLYTSYANNGILVNLDEVASGSFKVFRRIEGETFQLEDSVTSSYIDFAKSNIRKYFYKVDYIDSCNQILYSAETNPPFIKASKTSKNHYLIDFTFPVPLPDGRYILESNVGHNGNFSSETFSIINSTGSQNTFNFVLNLDSKDGTHIQQLSTKIYSLQGALLSQSNTLNLKFDLVIYVPNAFTPDNDGLNDSLEIFGLPTGEAAIKIYSKWGQLIYSSNSAAQGWDGKINGEVAQGGTYLYEIIFESSEGEKLTQKGTFALIKK